MIRVTALVLGLLLAGAGPAAAQGTSAAQIAAEDALTGGRPAEAVARADAILTADPENFDAHFVRAAALIELGRPRAAALAAGAAFRVAPDRTRRLQAARLASAARFRARQFTRAEWWLRRGANNVSNSREKAEIARSYAEVRKANPLTANLSFGVAPVGNFNDGSETDRIRFEGIGEFILPPEQQALSGIEYTLDLNANYRLSRSDRAETKVGLYLYGRTYTPSSEAEREVPGIDGGDYALGVVEGSVWQDRLIWPDLGLTTGRAYIGRLWYGGDPFWDYWRLLLSQNVRLADRLNLGLIVSTERQWGIDGRHADTDIHTLEARLLTRRENGDRVTVSLEKKVYLTEAFEASYDQYTLEASYDRAAPFLGIGWSSSLGIGFTDYEFFYASLDGRRDDTVFGSVTATWREVSYLGFSPELELSVVERESSVDRFSRSSLEIGFGVRSNF